jgi:hypothetical protein
MGDVINADFAEVERRYFAQHPESLVPLPLRRAIVARMYGAGDIKIALQLGRYPVPHDDLDRAERALGRMCPSGWTLT